MSSLNQITNIIAGHIGKEYDEPYKRNIIAKEVNEWRSTLLSRSLEKNPQQRSLFKQTIWIPMEMDKYETCDATLKAFMPIRYRSKAEIPLPMRIDNILFDYIGSPDGNNPYRRVDQGTVDYLNSQPYSNILSYEFTDLRIYSPRSNPLIKAETVFDDPSAVGAFNCSNGLGNCDFWNEAYPATDDIIQAIVQYVLQVNYNRPKASEDKEVITTTTTP